MKRYSVKVGVSGTGVIRHMVKAKDKPALHDRILAAYPGRQVQILTIEVRNVETGVGTYV